MAVSGEFPNNFTFSKIYIKLENHPAYDSLIDRQIDKIVSLEIKVFDDEKLEKYCMEGSDILLN